MSSSAELQWVLTGLPHFRFRSPEDLHVAERMLALLICNLDALSAEQKLLAKAFKTQIERYRGIWSDSPADPKHAR